MKLDKFWVVVDPGKYSTLADICFETSPLNFQYWSIGGARADGTATIYTERGEAESDANSRLEGRVAR